MSKHKTQIGKDAFVGSNSTLVAPLEIGDGSYIGAGSVITHAVPPDALALGRSRQVNKEGWAAKTEKEEVALGCASFRRLLRTPHHHQRATSPSSVVT